MGKFRLYIKRGNRSYNSDREYSKIIEINVKPVKKVMIENFDIYVKNETDVFAFNSNYWFSNSKKELIKFGNNILKKEMDELWDLKM